MRSGQPISFIAVPARVVGWALQFLIELRSGNYSA